MALGHVIDVDVFGTDRYGRTLGLIQVGNQHVNLELVKQGFAWWYKQYAPAAKDLRDAEQAARQAKRGLWVDANAVAPWDFRRAQKHR